MNANFSEVLFYGLIGQAAFTAVALGVVSFMQYRLSKKYYKLKDLEKGKLAEAEENARKQIEDAQKKALEIVNQSQTLTEETRKKMQAEMLASISKQLEGYQQIMEQVKTQVVDGANQTTQRANTEALSMVEQLKTAALNNIAQMSGNLQSSIAEQQAKLQQKVDIEFGSVKTAVDQYKQKKLELVDMQIDEVVMQTAREVVGKTLNATEHEELIMQALGRAKSENLLN